MAATSTFRSSFRRIAKAMSTLQSGWTKDTVAVVTGSNKGIGYETVKGLAKAGLSVVLTARDEAKGEEGLKSLHAEGLETVFFHPLTVNNTDSVTSLADWLTKQFGGIDILVNNAGIALMEVNYDNAFKTFDTNYWGVQKVTLGLLPLFKPGGLRRIVMVGSQVGQLKSIRGDALRKQLGDIDNLTFVDVETLAQKYVQDVKAGTLDEWKTFAPQYSESKVLLNTWSRVLAKFELSNGIYVNVVCPGFTATDMNDKNPKAKSIAEGADTPIWLSLLPKEGYPTSKFFVNRKEVEF